MPDRSGFWTWASASLVGLALLSGMERIWGYDFLWHLHAGEWMLRERSLLTADLWTLGGPKPYVNHYWLFQLFVALAFRASGFAGVVLLKAALFAATAMLLALAVSRGSRGPVSFLLLTAAVFVAQARIRERPEGFTWLFLAAALAILERIRRGESRRLAWALPPMMAVWANVHPLYVLGAGMVALAPLAGWLERLSGRAGTGSRFLDRRVLLPAGLALAACLLTPRPLEFLVHPFRLWLQSGGWTEVLTEGVTELQPSWRSIGEAPVLVGSILFLLALAAAIRARAPAVHFVWLVLFGYIGAVAYRNVPMMALIAGFLAAEHGGGRFVGASRSARVPAIAAVLVLALAYPTGWIGHWSKRTGRPGLGLQPDQFPVETARFLAGTPPGGVLPLNFGDGAALIYFLAREDRGASVARHPVAIDGRTDLHHPEDFARLFRIRTAIAEGEFDALDEAIPPAISALVVDHGDLDLIRALQGCRSFRLAKIDRRHLCYLREAIDPGMPVASLATRDGYDRTWSYSPLVPLLEPGTHRPRRPWRMHPLETHLRLGAIFSLLGEPALSLAYVECAAALGEGTSGQRRLFHALASAPLVSASGSGGRNDGLPVDPIGARALHLLNEALRRSGRGAIFDRQTAEMLRSGIAERTGADPDLVAGSDLPVAGDGVGAGGIDATRSFDRADRLLAAGWPAEARRAFAGLEKNPSRAAEADLRLLLCDWVEGSFHRVETRLARMGRAGPLPPGALRIETLLRETIRLRAP